MYSIFKSKKIIVHFTSLFVFFITIIEKKIQKKEKEAKVNQKKLVTKNFFLLKSKKKKTKVRYNLIKKNKILYKRLMNEVIRV